MPNTTARSSVSMELYYYAPPFASVDNTVFTLTIEGRRQTISGHHWWHPETKKLMDGDYTNMPPRPKHPGRSFVVVEVNGQIDVIEHRDYEQNRDPTRALFWMAEDPDILLEGRNSKANDVSR